MLQEYCPPLVDTKNVSCRDIERLSLDCSHPLDAALRATLMANRRTWYAGRASVVAHDMNRPTGLGCAVWYYVIYPFLVRLPTFVQFQPHYISSLRSGSIFHTSL